jgi:hypothetical protein
MQQLVAKYSDVLFLKPEESTPEKIWEILNSKKSPHSITFVKQENAVFFHDKEGKLRVTNPDVTLMTLHTTGTEVAVIHPHAARVNIVEFDTFFKEVNIPEIKFESEKGYFAVKSNLRAINPYPLSAGVLRLLVSEGVVRDIK